MNCVFGFLLCCIIATLVVCALRRNRSPERDDPPPSPADDVIPFIELPAGLPRVALEEKDENVDDQRVVAGLLKSMRDERHLWRRASFQERHYGAGSIDELVYTPTKVLVYRRWGLDEYIYITCGPRITNPGTIKLYTKLAEEITGYAAGKRAEERKHVAQRNEFILKVKS